MLRSVHDTGPDVPLAAATDDGCTATRTKTTHGTRRRVSTYAPTAHGSSRHCRSPRRTAHEPQPHRQPRCASLAVERICACEEEGRTTRGRAHGVSDSPQRSMGAGARDALRMGRAQCHLPAALSGAWRRGVRDEGRSNTHRWRMAADCDDARAQRQWSIERTGFERVRKTHI